MSTQTLAGSPQVDSVHGGRCICHQCRTVQVAILMPNRSRSFVYFRGVTQDRALELAAHHAAALCVAYIALEACGDFR
jgi:hypothetical protein